MERICQFHIRGRCNRSNCEFKHSSLPNSGNSVPKANANRPCKFFESSGFCRMGENCRFLHEKSLNLPKRRPMLDSDEEILKGPDSDDDDSVVSGFTEHMAVLAREPEFDFSDREEDYESGGALKESQPLHNPDANINKEHDPFKDKCNNSGETITLGDDSSTILKDNTCVEDQKTTSTLSKSPHDQSPYVEKEISVEDHNEKDQVCRSSSTEDHSIRQESHSDKIVPQDPNDDKEAEDELLILSPEKNGTKEIYTPVSSSKSKTKPKKTLPNHNLPLPKFDPDKFKPGYIPPIIKDGDAEYAVVVTGVKDTGLCGKYWGDMNNLSSRRKSRVSHVQDQSSAITNSIKKTMKRTSSRSYSKNAKMHEEDDNKKSLNDTRLSPKNTQITSINSKEYHIFNSSSNGTKYQSSDNLTQESTCDADDLPSKSSIELKNSSNQSQKSITNKKSKSLSPKKRRRNKSLSAHDDSQNHFPKRGRVDTPAHGNNSYHSFENSSRKKSSFIDVEKIKKNDKCQPMDCYVTPPRPDSHIKNLQINLEGTCNGADMEKFEPNQEASISSLRPFTPKTLDYSTIHECLSTTSYDSSNASIELPFKERYAPYDDHKWANLGKDILSRDAVQYTRALSLQNHLLSFLRIKGNSMKGMSNTNKNSVIFVVIEGEISVVLHSCKKQFYAKKGDSFHVPPNFSYNLINKKVREAELTIFQF